MMDSAVDFLNTHYGEDFHIDDLIRFMGYGRTRLFTLFKRHTGLTPNEYLVRLRIRKASELLSRGETDIGRIAKSVGFSNASDFRSVFLKYTGAKP